MLDRVHLKQGAVEVCMYMGSSATCTSVGMRNVHIHLQRLQPQPVHPAPIPSQCTGRCRGPLCTVEALPCSHLQGCHHNLHLWYQGGYHLPSIFLFCPLLFLCCFGVLLFGSILPGFFMHACAHTHAHSLKHTLHTSMQAHTYTHEGTHALSLSLSLSLSALSLSCFKV